MVQPYQPLYTIKEASQILKVSTAFVYSEVNAGRLSCVRLGSMKIRGSDLECYIEKYPVIVPGEWVSVHEEDRSG